ncbi:anthranilate synthase component II [Daejeonella oryzae]|uniref:anthranilate synthase component II n=1 Tax=Daejeonella oryzae TaxID=1122943 RepID=UPI0004119052|nr:aminodeoxychorismate/anthranilate synthase component II [Daejeonella oryzae]
MNSSKKNILVIDNYDSFTFNLVHLLNETGNEATVWRNDKFDLTQVDEFDKILLSPGPGIPSEAGLLQQVIKTYSATKSILGICLGMQAIAEVFGGSIYNLSKPVHGRATLIDVLDKNDSLFYGCPDEFKVGRYHSWAVNQDDLPADLKVTATDSSGVIMALSHASLNVKGVQFHPESILTEHGKLLIENWLNS